MWRLGALRDLDHAGLTVLYIFLFLKRYRSNVRASYYVYVSFLSQQRRKSGKVESHKWDERVQEAAARVQSKATSTLIRYKVCDVQFKLNLCK